MAKSQERINPVIVHVPILMKYGGDQGMFALALASTHWEGTFESAKGCDVLIDQAAGKVNIESLSKARYSAQSPDVQWAARIRGDVQRKTIAKYLKHLVSLGAMTNLNMSDKEAAWTIQRKAPQTSAIYFGNICEWCGSDTACLHDHHYPIRRSHGGTETVAICPNCHTEFHQLTDWNLYAFSEQFLNELEDLQDGMA